MSKKKDNSKPMKDMLGNQRTEAEYYSASSWKTAPLARGCARYKCIGELDWVFLAAEKKGSRPILMHAWGDGQRLAATDGYRLHVIPSDLSGYFDVAKGVAAPAQEDGKYPDYNQIIPKKCARWVKLPAGTLWRALAVAWTYAKNLSNHRVKLALKALTDVSLTIYSTDAETGECTCILQDKDELDGQRIRVRASGDTVCEFVIAVNAKYLLDAISAFPAEAEVKLAFNTNSQPIVVTGTGSEAKAVIMPLHLGER